MPRCTLGQLWMMGICKHNTQENPSNTASVLACHEKGLGKNSWLSIRHANDLPGGTLHYRVPSIVHGWIINKLRVFSRALTRPPVAGSRPSPAPARRSFLHAPSTPHGTSCNSPEEGDTNKHRCYWSQLKCTGERETAGLHFIHPVGKKGHVSVAQSPLFMHTEGVGVPSIVSEVHIASFPMHNALWPFWN